VDVRAEQLGWHDQAWSVGGAEAGDDVHDFGHRSTASKDDGGVATALHENAAAHRRVGLLSGCMWWTQAGTLLIGLIGIAVGANWFSSRAARGVRSLKADAEILHLLPVDSPGHILMSQHLDKAVSQHLVERENPGLQRWRLFRGILMWLTFLWAGMLLGLGVWGLFNDPPDWYPIAAIGANVTMAVVLVGLRVATSRTLREMAAMRAKYGFDEKSVESADAAGEATT
jgi:hypothetical protein